MTKLQKKVNASKRSKKKRIAVALQKFLKTQNPAAKYAGAKIQRNKGSITIIPVKASQLNPGGGSWRLPRGKKIWFIYKAGRFLGTVEATTKTDALRKARSKFGPGEYRAGLT